MLLAGTTLDLTSGTSIALDSVDLTGLTTVDDLRFGSTTLTLADGTALTVALGPGFTTVLGADNADTILGGQGGQDTVTLGGTAESFLAGTTGATVLSDAAYLQAGRAALDGGGRSELDVIGTGMATLGAEIAGFALLDVRAAGTTLDTGLANFGEVLLQSSGDALTLRQPGAVVEDCAGGNAIAFAAAGQTLVLPYSDLLAADPAAPLGGMPVDHVSGFATGDVIEIALTPGAGETIGRDASGEVVIASGGYAQTIDLSAATAALAPLTLGAVADPNTGRLWTTLSLGAAAAAEAPCFAAGTRLLTEAGPRPVESLAAGERLVTAAGRLAEIRWIGHRHIDCRRHPRPALVQPVRIAAGAFAPGLPGRDVVLSPDHAVFADGVLLPAKLLLNGATVTQEVRGNVTYFHVELARHDVVLAEGLPVESYLDTGNRHQFANGDAHLALHPDFAPLGWERACAPLVQEGPVLAGVRARLLERAAELGHATTGDDALHLVADGRAIALRREGGLAVAAIEHAPRRLSLVSRSAMPAETDAASLDRRRLGVACRAIVLRDAARQLRITAEDRRLSRGFHPVERDGGGAWRWTDGRGVIPAILWAALRPPFAIEIELVHSLRYRLAA